jgi:hypothetical protein
MTDGFRERETLRKRRALSMSREEGDRANASSRSEDEFDRFFGSASPNPDRVGCPPTNVLQALARKERRIDDPAYEHLENCSPCYREFRRLQQQRPSIVSRRLLAVAALIAVVLAGAVIYFFNMRSGGFGDRTPTIAKNPSAKPRAVLDLRPIIVTRGQKQAPNNEPLRLSRTDLSLDVLLPVGLEPGQYELRLVDENLQSVLSRETVSTMENQVATIHTSVDLRNVKPGSYHLAIRRPREEWHIYSLRIE